MIKLTINGKTVEIEDGATIMEAAAKAGIKIPSLCHLKMSIHTVPAGSVSWRWLMKNLQASCIGQGEGGHGGSYEFAEGPCGQKGPV